MTTRRLRPIAAMLSVLLFTGGPVHAGPVAISEVIQLLGRFQNPPDLRLRSLTQTPGTPISGVKGSTGSGTATPSNSLLAGLAVNSNDPQRGVEIIDQGDVEGTICDCGDILVPGGDFPKWPLLFLAAIPFFFIDTGGDIDTPVLSSAPPLTPTPFTNPTPNSTPTPSQTPIPEPASLLLFGSGLAALGTNLRRRYKARLLTRVDASKES